MSLLRGLLGNAAEIDAQEIEGEFSKLIAEGEQVQKVYKVIRDRMVFTDRRLVLVDRQGMTGKKTEYHSIPYRNITHFLVESAGHLDLEAELKIWVSGDPGPICKTFRRDGSIYDVQRALAAYVK